MYLQILFTPTDRANDQKETCYPNTRPSYQGRGEEMRDMNTEQCINSQLSDITTMQRVKRAVLIIIKKSRELMKNGDNGR